MKIAGVNIGRTLAQALPSGSRGLPAITLVKVTFAARATSTGGKVPTESSHATRGTKEQTAKAGDSAGSSMRTDKDARFFLLAHPLGSVVPAANDLILYTDPDTSTSERWRIVSVETDPANAGHSCTARKA